MSSMRVGGIYAVLLSFALSTLADGRREKERRSKFGLHFTPPPASLQNAAQYLLDSIDLNEDICEDAYRFSCKRWTEANPIAETDSKNSRYTQLQEKVLLELQISLTRDEVNTSVSIAKAHFAFRKCSDEAAIEATGTSELRAELDRLGGWPLIDPNSPNGRADADLTALLIAIYRERAKQSLVLFSVLPDYENSSRYLLQFEVEGPQLETPEYYLEAAYSHIVEAYEKYLVQVARTVADDSALSIRTEEIKAGVREVLRFDRQLAAIRNATQLSEDVTENVLRIRFSDLQVFMPLIDWNRFVRAAWPTELSDFIAGDPEVYVSSPEEFFALTSLMERNPAMVLDYVLTAYVQQRTITLDGRFDRLAAEFARVASGTKGKEPRAEVCTTYTTALLPLAANALYIRNHFDETTRKEVEELVDEIRSVFVERIEKSEWMDETTREFALQKLRAMRVYIGHSPGMDDERAMDEEYSNIAFTPSSTWDEVVRIVRIERHKQELRKLLSAVSDERMAMGAVKVNAQYSFRNVITLPAALLQPPVWDPTFPKVFRYAGLGSIVAHEISHAFDNDGSQFDSNGNVLNWWNEETHARFLDRTKCVVHQYSQFEVPELGIRLNGNLTQGESIADIGGLKLAFQAFQRHKQQSKGPPLVLPGLEQFTEEQLFFLAYAALECTNERTSELIDEMIADVHPPSRFRVNGALANEPQFAAAFGCPPGSPLNPTERCEVW